MAYYEPAYSGKYMLRWEYDNDSSDPREDDKLAHAIRLGDINELDGRDHPLETGARHFWEMSMHPERDFMRWARIFHGAIIVEGGSATRSGNTIWYLTGEEVQNLLTKGWDSVEQIAKAIDAERESYENWCDGEVYRYIIHEFSDGEDDLAVDPRTVGADDDRWDAIEWCGSWYFLKDAWDEGLSVLDSLAAEDVRKNYAEALSLFGWKVAA